MNREIEIQTSHILGVDVACLDKTQLLELAFDWCKDKHKRTIVYVNAHCLNIASRNPNFLAQLRKVDLIYADGISIVWASRFLGGGRIQKITGREWIYDFCQIAEQNKIKVGVFGGAPGVTLRAVQVLTEKYPELQIVDIGHGYLLSQEDQFILNRIREFSPDVVFVGMGTPKQELWVMRHRDAIIAPVCWTVGAAFDYVAGIEKPYPDSLRHLPLEWFWRLLINPPKKWKRYLVGNPLFILRILKQKYSITN